MTPDKEVSDMAGSPTNHPNRKRGGESPCRSPHPEEIKSVRLALSLTQVQAAQSVCYSERGWQHCESGERRMHPAAWRLFKILHGLDADWMPRGSSRSAESVDRSPSPADLTDVTPFTKGVSP
jgi:DNA-binding transcriptional regulator YiaG